MAQIGPHVTLHATSKRSSVGIVVGTSGFVSLRDGSAIGIESSWTHEARNDRFEVLPQIHVHPTRHLRLQMGLGGRLDLGTKRLTAIVGLRFIVER